jgi:hypothetical protein
MLHTMNLPEDCQIHVVKALSALILANPAASQSAYFLSLIRPTVAQLSQVLSIARADPAFLILHLHVLQAAFKHTPLRLAAAGSDVRARSGTVPIFSPKQLTL